ncbi:MAG: DNA polymerase III subunit epsilon [Hydrotalea sp.]|nr:DNA polymerase III subunit epsilon [Hydrotalea sp.]
MSTQRYVVLDTETTGFKPEEGHRIVEIGAVELHGFQKGDTYQQYINPERDVPEASFQVHGLSQKFLKNKPVFADVVNDFLAFIGDATLLIHNSDFDMNFINHHLAELGFPILKNNVIDTVTVARKKFPGQSNSLDALCRRFNISLDDRQQHGALKDSLLLVDVWLELNGGRQASLNLNPDNNKAKADAGASSDMVNPGVASTPFLAGHATAAPSNGNDNGKSPLAPRHFVASADELAQHQQLLHEKIPNNIWRATAS